MVFSTGKKNEQDKLESTVSNLHPMRAASATRTRSWPSIPACQVRYSAATTNTPPSTRIRPNNVIVLYSPVGNGDNEWLPKQEGLLITDARVASNWKRLRVQILIDWKQWLGQNDQKQSPDPSCHSIFLPNSRCTFWLFVPLRFWNLRFLRLLSLYGNDGRWNGNVQVTRRKTRTHCKSA